MVAHILYYFSEQNDLVFDPMAGGGVVDDTCLAFNRKCWSFDMDDRPETRPEIEPYFWDITNLKWPIKGKTKPDLIIFDPPYFKKQSNNYDPDGISGMSKANYLEFLENFFSLAHLMVHYKMFLFAWCVFMKCYTMPQAFQVRSSGYNFMKSDTFFMKLPLRSNWPPGSL
jgi:DNA modification methylase